MSLPPSLPSTTPPIRSVVVTGAGGLIGRATSAALSRAGYHVIGVDRCERVPGADGDWVTADLAAGGLTQDLFDPATALVHLAAIPSPGGIGDLDLFVNNTASTFAVLDAAGHAGVRRAVIASSVSIYGMAWSERELTPPTIPLTEATELTGTDAYALSKEVDEATAKMMCRRHGLSIAALRFPNVASENDVRRRSEQAASDPNVAHRELWAYLTLDDAARAVLSALTANFVGCVVANIVSTQSLADYDAPALARQFYPTAVYAEDASRVGYSTTVARDVLGFIGTEILA